MIKPNVTKDLDHIFEALANQHRRDIIYVLGLQPYSISQLAKMQKLSLPAIHKHLKVLKTAQIIKDKKIGRVHVLTLDRKSLQSLQEWLNQYQAYWGTDSESLENYAQFVSKNKKVASALPGYGGLTSYVKTTAVKERR